MPRRTTSQQLVRRRTACLGRETPAQTVALALRPCHNGGTHFRRVGRSCRKPPVPRSPSTAAKKGGTPALIPDGSVCTPDLSITGQREFTMGQKGGDKFLGISFAPRFPSPSRMLRSTLVMRCWSETHQRDRNRIGPGSAAHRCALHTRPGWRGSWTIAKEHEPPLSSATPLSVSSINSNISAPSQFATTKACRVHWHSRALLYLFV